MTKISDMLSGNKVSKGGLIGAIIGLVASIFSHNTNDGKGKKVIKSGAFGIAGYILGSAIENKMNQKRN